MPEKPFYEFLYSEVVQLRSSDSERTLNVHKALLESRCKAIHSGLSKGFSESQEGVYTCSDTTHDTLTRVIEWMYTGTYTQALSNEAEIETGQYAEVEQGAKSNTLSEVAEDMENDQIMANLRLYIFSNIYLMTGLKKVAFQNLTSYLTVVDKIESPESQRAVIAMLHVAFSNIQPGDELLGWLAHFASWNLDKLLRQSLFNDLLLEVPALSLLMMTSLRPAVSTPWCTRKAKRARLQLHVPQEGQ